MVKNTLSVYWSLKNQNRTHDPVIIFRAEEALKTVGPCKMVSAKEVIANLTDAKDELKKKGEQVKP